MNVEEAKGKFIAAWGVLGSDWGISRTMAQVHALLLISPEPMGTEEVMEDLKISRGNANMNLRALIDWNLVYKVIVPGERREFFAAEKDIHKVAIRILNERRKRELQPILQVMNEIKLDTEVKGEAADEMKRVLLDIEKFSKQADSLAEKMTKIDQSRFWSSILKLMS